MAVVVNVQVSSPSAGGTGSAVKKAMAASTMTNRRFFMVAPDVFRKLKPDTIETCLYQRRRIARPVASAGHLVYVGPKFTDLIP